MKRRCEARNRATATAFASWRSTRSASVFRPRSVSQQSKGASALPVAFCTKAMRFASASSRTATKPHIVSLCGSWEENEHLYILMELCRGSLSSELPHEEVDQALNSEDEVARASTKEIVTLRRNQRRSVGRLHIAELRQRLIWIMECMDALAYIHQQGISHRDIKPANLLTSVDSRLKLGDFGTATLALSNLRTSRSERSYLMGTPVYIAPELWRAAQEGDLAEQDLMRSDQYAFGITLVEILQRGKQLSTLEHLPSPPQTPAEYVLFQQVHTRGIYADIRVPERDGTPESVNEVVKKLLSPNPYHRYDNLGRCMIDLVAAFLKDNLLRA